MGASEPVMKLSGEERHHDEMRGLARRHAWKYTLSAIHRVMAVNAARNAIAVQ